MEKYGIDGHADLARDPQTNAVLNVNSLEHQQYIARRKAKTEKNKKVNSIEEEVATLKNDMDEIKSLLKVLINGNKS